MYKRQVLGFASEGLKRGVIRIESTSGKRLDLDLKDSWASTLAPLPDSTGRILVAGMRSGHGPKVGRLWTINPGTETVDRIPTSPSHTLFRTVNFSPGGKSFALVTAYSKEKRVRGPLREHWQVQVRSTDNMKLLWTANTDFVPAALKFSVDGSSLVCCGEAMLVVFNSADGNVIRKKSILPPRK